MPLTFVRNDIARMDTDAVVLPANEYLKKGPGASTVLFSAAGEAELEDACRSIGYVPMGETAVTKGFRLRASYIIHAVVPLWQGGQCREEEFLRKAYRNSLLKAAEYHMESVAFPLLSSGNFGYPKDEALNIAVDEITGFLENNEMEVYIVLYGEKDLRAASGVADDIDEYIDNNYVFEQEKISYSIERSVSYIPRASGRKAFKEACMSEPDIMCDACECDIIDDIDLAIEKGFAETLLDLIDSKGLSDPQAYHASNIDRKLFSKIKNSKGYTPKKNTVLSFCIGLRLTLPEAEDLLKRAGYAFSPCSKFDLVIRYFIETGDYKSIHDVNIALFDRFLPTLN